MKTINRFLFATITSMVIFSCNKEYNYTPPVEEPPPPPLPVSAYNSMHEFHAANEVKLQSSVINGVSGGTFISLDGVAVTIPANAFVTQSGDPVTGDVTLEFKEVYKKSDMILSDKPAMESNGNPLKSGGEFFMKATSSGEVVMIAPGANIMVQLPDFGLPADPGMNAYVAQLNPFSWNLATNATMGDSANLQVFISQFLNPPDSGTWYNCDNPGAFAGYTQTPITLRQGDAPISYGTQVYLVFDDYNTVIHIYNVANTNDFLYDYAPVGLKCLGVAVGVKDSVLYMSLVPITIGVNQTYNFTLSPVAEDVLKAQLQLLD